jgi:hypothetical protein
MDLLITWPKKRSFESYLKVLAYAAERGEVINFRIARLPKLGFLDWSGRNKRCYVVYDGAVRGYNEILDLLHLDADEVSGYYGESWGAGNYIVRDPLWYPVEPVPHRGFQGWHYYEGN